MLGPGVRNEGLLAWDGYPDRLKREGRGREMSSVEYCELYERGVEWGNRGRNSNRGTTKRRREKSREEGG